MLSEPGEQLDEAKLAKRCGPKPEDNLLVAHVAGKRGVAFFELGSRLALPEARAQPAQLAKSHTVIAPDLRGFGQSAKPSNGYTKKAMAQDIHALAISLGLRKQIVVGHDIGLMVAYAYAAQYPTEVDRIVLMDAFLPGVGDWTTVWLLRDLWHFHFYGVTPLKLVTGRERIYFEHFWNDFAADPKHSVPEADRRFYAAAYAQPGAMRSGFEVFRGLNRMPKTSRSSPKPN